MLLMSRSQMRYLGMKVVTLIIIYVYFDRGLNTSTNVITRNFCQGEGVQHPKNFDKQKEKKKKKKRKRKKGHKRGGRGLHYLFCIGMIEI